MPQRIARQVHIGLDGHEDSAIVFDGRHFGMEAAAGQREAARGRTSTLSIFVSTQRSGNGIDALANRQVPCDIACAKHDGLGVHRRALLRDAAAPVTASRVAFRNRTPNEAGSWIRASVALLTTIST
jgi:hypothetical protein